MNRKERRAAGKKAGLRAPSAGPNELMADAIRHQASGRYEEAEHLYRRALAADPTQLDALQHLGALALRTGRPTMAIDLFTKALALNDRSPQCHYRIGLAHAALNRPADAAIHYQRAIALQPGLIEAYNDLGRAFFSLGRIDEALGALRRAIGIGGTAETKALFIQILRSQKSIPDLDDLRNLMLEALSVPWRRASEVAPIAASLIKYDKPIRAYVERASAAWPRRLGASELLGSFGLAAVCGHPLLACHLQSTPVTDVALERFLTAMRFVMLEMAAGIDASVGVEDRVLSFCGALARQCFLNEYVFSYDDDEFHRAQHQRHQLTSALEADAVVQPFQLALIAAYFPLRSVPGTNPLLDRAWPAPIAALLVQQLREPEQETQLRAAIPALTQIEDETSLRVQRQYEENPYPRWQKAPPPLDASIADPYLRATLPFAPLRELGEGSNVDILIAGCGTGQHAVETAQAFPHARVLAVDLSIASLAYAKRKTAALGLGNIEYAQADILRLGEIARTFDVIEPVGVLHHLADPWAGWRILLSLLRREGWMRLGLYSELARRHITTLRTLIAERGYAGTADDIRRCRQELMSCAGETAQQSIIAAEDFFTTSECRDLLFHVQEHRHTLPQIAAFLVENNLEFLGFELSADVRRQYRNRFPADATMTDLDLWHVFESENPDTFRGMYQFAVRKKAR